MSQDQHWFGACATSSGLTPQRDPVGAQSTGHPAVADRAGGLPRVIRLEPHSEQPADGLRRGLGPWLRGGQKHPPCRGVGFGAVHCDRPLSALPGDRVGHYRDAHLPAPRAGTGAACRSPAGGMEQECAWCGSSHHPVAHLQAAG